MSADAADEVDELAAYFELAVGNAPLDGSTMTPAAMVRGVLGSWNASGKYRLQRAGFKIIKGVVDRVLADFKLAVSQLQLAQRNHENLQALRNLGLAPVPPKQQELENGQRAWAVIKPPTDPGIIHHLVQHAKATRTSTPLVIPPYDALTLQMKMDALTAKCDAILAQAELFVKNDENAIVPVLPQEGRALLEAPPTNYQQPQQAYVQQQQYNGVQQGIYQQPQPAVQQQVYPQVYPPQYGGSSSQAGPSGVQQASVQAVDPIAQQWYEVATQQQHNVQPPAASSSSHTNGTGFVQQNAATAAPSYAPVFNNVTSTPTQASVSNGKAAQAAQMERLAQQQRQQQAMQEQLRLQQQQQQREAQERKERERRQQEHERLMEQQRVQHEHQRLQEQQRQQQLEQQRLEQERQREQEKQRQERERLEQQRQQQLLEKQRQEQQLRERLLEEQRRQQQAQAQSQAGPYAQSVSQSQASTSTTTAPAQGATAVPQATFKESSYSSLSGALGPTTSSSTSQQPSSAAKKSTGGASSAASAAHERQALLYQQAYADRYRQYSSQLAKQGETHSNPTYPFLPSPLTGVLPAGAPGQPRPGNSAMGQNGLAAGQKVPPFMGVVPLPHPGPNGQALPHHRYFVHYSFATPPAAPPAPRAAPPTRQQQPGPAVTPQSARRSTLARDIINALEGASALASVQPAPAKRKRKRSQAKAATTRRPSSPGGTTSEHADIELVTPAVAQSRLPKASRGPAAMDVDVDADGGATIEEVDADAGAVRKKQPLFWSDSSPDPDVQMQGTRSEDDVDNLLASASSPDGQNNAGASRARTPRLFPPSALPKPRAPPPAKPAISDLFREVRNGWALPKPDRLIVELPRLPKDWRPRILEADYGRFSDFSSRLSTRRCHWSDCPAVLDSEDHLQLHWDKVHGAAKSYDRDFSCLWNVCDLRPTSLEKLRHHVRCRHIRDGLRCAYDGCDFRGSGEADLAAHIAAEHGAGTLRRLAVPQQVVPVQIIPDLPQGVRPAWSLTTPPVRPAAISRERRDLLGNWVLMRIYATVDYGLITAKSPSYQRGKRKEPAPPPQMEPLVEGFELRAKEQFEWLRPASPDLPRRIPRELRVGQRPEPAL